MNSKEILNGVIENVVFHNDENDYTVLEISDVDSNLITAVGSIPIPHEGECVRLVGNWVYHKEFGKQFSFEEYEKSLPEDVDGILQYLSSKAVKGVGPVTALKIVNKYGKDSFDVIENHPEWLTDISGITMKKAAAISVSFREQNGAREVVMFCKDYMTSADSMKIYKRYGSSAVGIIKENPYIICSDECGVSFQIADNIAKKLGHSESSEFRILCGVEHLLSRAAISMGHTCLPYNELLCEASKLLEISEDVIFERTEELFDAGKLAKYKKDEETYIMSVRTDRAESYIARRIFKIFDKAYRFSTDDVGYLIERAEAGNGIEYAEMQRRAIYEAMMCGAIIITGGPGTGKTTIIKALYSIFKAVGMKVALAAPTGRAAKRMSEATSAEAKTIHRLLETEKTRTDENRFMRNDKNPIDEDVVIIDEASMIDLYLAEALLRAIRRGGRLILIGDADQLPSVGAGNLLSDLIASECIPTIRLTDIFRQSKESLIVTNAHRINNGEQPVLTVADKDFFFVRRDNEADICETVAALISERLPKTYGSGIRERIQVITPSKRGAAGVEAMNAHLQERLNPKRQFKKERSRGSTVFREGDKVMQVVNDYDVEWENGKQTGHGVFNGDIGVIDEINEREEYLKVRFDDKSVKYKYDMLDELELAYAITVHKSQGSEYPVVILPMYSCAPQLMMRNLLYTAVTRARGMLILVGRPDVPGRMVENNRQINRYTTLKNRICEYS